MNAIIIIEIVKVNDERSFDEKTASWYVAMNAAANRRIA